MKTLWIIPVLAILLTGCGNEEAVKAVEAKGFKDVRIVIKDSAFRCAPIGANWSDHKVLSTDRGVRQTQASFSTEKVFVAIDDQGRKVEGIVCKKSKEFMVRVTMVFAD